MGPSFSSKNGVRYRFYVSTALRGRKAQGRLGHADLGAGDRKSCREQRSAQSFRSPNGRRYHTGQFDHRVERPNSCGAEASRASDARSKFHGPQSQGDPQWTAASEPKNDQKLMKSIVRAHAWLDDLSTGRHASVEDLAAAADLHPKVVRQGLRLAFLPPD